MAATLDQFSGNVNISGGGLIATPTTSAGALARTSLGRSTGKFYWTAMITAQPPEGEQQIGFGFVTASAPLSGQTGWPGNSDATPLDTGLTILPISKFVFSNAAYRFYDATSHWWIATFPRAAAFAVDLDAQKWWICWYDPDTMISAWGWSYDDGTSSPPVSDPTLATGASYASWVDDNEIFPALMFGQTGYSGTISFDPSAIPCGFPAGYSPWDSTPPPSTSKHTHVFA
jgi:hypothetical protein